MKYRKKVIVVCMLICITIVAYIIRFNYLNSQFPESKLCIVKAGETVENNGLKYSAVAGEIMTGKDYMEKYGDEDNYEADENVLVVYFDVENTTDKTQKIGIMDMVLNCGLWANGVDYYSLWYVNDEDFDNKKKKSEKVRVGVTTTINTNLERWSGCEWRIRIKGWPNRIELTVPMNGGEA